MKPEEKIWEEWDVMHDALFGDVHFLEDLLSRSNSGAVRRAYCRAVFAYVEGMAGWMKRYTILCYCPQIFGADEKQMLLKREGALQNLSKAFDCFTDVAGAETPLREGSPEWKIIKAAIAIRNRITHPAKATDVSISDSDLSQLREVRKLFTELINQCLKESAAALQRRADEAEKVWQSHHDQTDDKVD